MMWSLSASCSCCACRRQGCGSDKEHAGDNCGGRPAYNSLHGNCRPGKLPLKSTVQERADMPELVHSHSPTVEQIDREKNCPSSLRHSQHPLMAKQATCTELSTFPSLLWTLCQGLLSAVAALHYQTNMPLYCHYH